MEVLFPAQALEVRLLFTCSPKMSQTYHSHFCVHFLMFLLILHWTIDRYTMVVSGLGKPETAASNPPSVAHS